MSVADAEQATLEYVKQHVPKPSTAPLCGNSIGTDRGFLARYMTELDDYLHYRSIDVSSLKELCRRWNPALYRKRPGKAEHHRALDDIRESIEELRFYRDNFLDLPAPAEPTRTGVSQRVCQTAELTPVRRRVRGALRGRRGGRLPSALARRGP